MWSSPGARHVVIVLVHTLMTAWGFLSKSSHIIHNSFHLDNKQRIFSSQRFTRFLSLLSPISSSFNDALSLSRLSPTYFSLAWMCLHLSLDTSLIRFSFRSLWNHACSVLCGSLSSHSSPRHLEKLWKLHICFLLCEHKSFVFLNWCLSVYINDSFNKQANKQTNFIICSSFYSVYKLGR